MRLLLHAGMPKTGSSALQKTLTRAHEAMRRKGVLYPLTRKGNHNFALAGFVPFDRISRIDRRHYATKRDRLERDFRRYWQTILLQIKRHRPHTLVLSGEAFSRRLSTTEINKLNQLLRPLASHIEVVLYVRRPSEAYLSLLQQKLRASAVIKPVTGIKYRPFILPYQEQIADVVHVVPFARDTLQGQDIALDFAARFLPECYAEIDAARIGSVNETVSAESMSILCAYRRFHHFEREDVHTQDSTALLNLLQQVERQTGLYARPELQPQIRAAVDGLSTDLLWLQDAFGISFQGLDLASVQTGQYQPLYPQDVETVCIVDAAKRDRLLLLLLSTLLNQKGGSFTSWVRSLFGWMQFHQPEMYHKLAKIWRRP